MSKILNISFLSAFLCINTFMMITCSLPLDPAKNPNVVDAEILLIDPAPPLNIIQGKQATFGIRVTYPMHINSVVVSFDANRNNDTTVYCKTKSADPETLIVKFTYLEDGTKTVKATIKLSNGNAKETHNTFNITRKNLEVKFTTCPKPHLAAIDEPDTLLFTAYNDSSRDGIVFRSSSEPLLDNVHLRLITKKDTALLIVTPIEKKTYNVYCFARYGYASDTANVKINTYKKPVFSSSSGNETQLAGTKDTLLFTLPEGENDSLQFTLLDSNSYKPGVITILQKLSDTIKIVFTPDETKTYSFRFLITKDSLSDTIIYQRNVTVAQKPIWKQPSDTITATEGKTTVKPLAIYLNDSTLDGITFKVSKGTISNKTLSYSVPWGNESNDLIIISATHNNLISEFKLYLNVNSGDSSAPKILRITPESDNYITNSDKTTCKFAITDSGAGIRHVTFTKNTTTITDTSHSDSLYQCIINNLKHKETVTLKVTVTDASMRKNSSSQEIKITRDSTTAEKEPPTISHLSGTKSGERVSEATGVIKVSITDGSGIANVTITLNGTELKNITNNKDEYIIPFTLPKFNTNRIVVNATDNTQYHNTDSMVITLIYNTTISAITAVSPGNDSTGLDLLPSFTWSGGDDADGDSVFYTVFYGTNASDLNMQIQTAAQKSVKVSTALSANAAYYWQVIGYSKTYPDTVKSDTLKFTTMNDDIAGPVIIFKNRPAEQSRVKETEGSIVVTVTDPSGIKTVTATLNGNELTGITSSGSDYTIPYTITKFGTNTIKITAIDNSPAQTASSQTTSFICNTVPSAITSVIPVNGAEEVDTFPVFKWTSGKDTDGDSVFYRIRYGTTTEMNALTPEVNTDSIKLSAALPTFTKYYWQLIAFTKGDYKDTVLSPASGTYSFTTLNPDRTIPKITILNPDNYTAGMRVTTASGTVSFTATDANGIDSVYYTVNNGPKNFSITNTAAGYNFTYTLTRFGFDTLTIYAVDKSAEHNRSSLVIIFNYNLPLPEEISVINPGSNAVELPLLPTFKWTKLVQEDKDDIYYRVEYSKDENLANIKRTGEVKNDTVKLATGDSLEGDTKYFYRVIGYTKSPFKDSTRSEIRSFTTVNRKPEVTIVFPANGGTRINPVNGALEFNGSDPERGTISYTVALSNSSNNILTSPMRISNLSTTTCNLSTFASINYATEYFWQVIATDNGSIRKSDTSGVYRFYTVNRAPVWTTIPDKDSTYYHCTIDLSKFCTEPDGNNINYSLVNTTNASINVAILTCGTDSQLITVQAIDNFVAQPCTSKKTFRRWFVSPQMQLIPAKNANFIMGTNDTFMIFEACTDDGSDDISCEQKKWNEAQPLHTVNFKNNFYMDSTEVTQADYELLMRVNPSNSTKGPKVAVHNTTWFDAALYCNERSKRDGLDSVYTYISITGIPGNQCSGLSNIKINYSKNGYRLPTEAEWEFACRANTTTIAYWPNNDSAKNYAWYYHSSDESIDTIYNVAQLIPNNFHLYDMIGNVSEWCNDYYGNYSPIQQTDPTGAENGNQHISRGSYGKWFISPNPNYWETKYTYANCAFRLSYGPYGFRCVRTKF